MANDDVMWLWRLTSPTFQNKTYPENWPPRHDLTHPIWLANFRAAVLDSIHLLFLNGICTKKYRSLSKYIHELRVRVRTHMGEISPSLKIRGSNAWESKSPPCHRWLVPVPPRSAAKLGCIRCISRKSSNLTRWISGGFPVGVKPEIFEEYFDRNVIYCINMYIYIYGVYVNIEYISYTIHQCIFEYFRTFWG